MVICSQYYQRWMFSRTARLCSHRYPPAYILFCLPFARMCKNTCHLTSVLPRLWSGMSPIHCTSLGPDRFSFSLLILSPILKLHFTLILLSSVHLHLLLISKEISDRPCLFLPSGGHSHLLFRSTHLSPGKAQEN